jgi:hypothetical protein
MPVISSEGEDSCPDQTASGKRSVGLALAAGTD